MTAIMETRIDSGDMRENAIKEAKLEQLLSEKLMQGYVLLETSCPVCSTPLVKNHAMVPRNLSSNSSDSMEGGQFAKHVLLPNESFDQPFRPVEGVPICVSCKSHVITQETEVSILEQCDSLKDKGSILVALNDMKCFDDDNKNDQAKANVVPPEIIHLEDVEEETFMASRSPKNVDAENAMNNHRHLHVDIQAVECASNDGHSNFEIMPSPLFIENRDNDDEEVDDDLKPDSVPHIFVDNDEIEDEEPQQPSHPEPIFVEDPAYLNSRPPRSQSEDELNDEDPMEYSVRREIATKVLGAKMLQGYTLQEVTCDTCAMPLMDYKGKVDCVVCPIIEKKARKRLKAKKKLEEERVQLERKVQEKKELEQKMEEERLESERREMERIVALRQEEQKMEEERLECERLEMERIITLRQEEEERLVLERSIKEGERQEEERIANERIARERAELECLEYERQQQKLEIERLEEEERRELERCIGEERAEKERIDYERIDMNKQEKKAKHEKEALERREQERIEVEEKARHEHDALARLQQIRLTMEQGKAYIDGDEERTQALEEEEYKILEQARERARMLVDLEEQEEMSRLETIANEEEEMRRILEAQREKEESLAARQAEQKAKQEDEETLLLEETKKIEAFDENTISDKTEAVKKDLLVEEHRKRLAGKALIDKDVAELMEEREREALELRRLSEDRRIESEDRMIAALEAEAAVKALTAEAAISRARVALEEVSTAKKEIMTQTIAQAEIETLAETEKVIKAQCEDYKEDIILPSALELTKEHWETLRAESRAIMTRRILQGWELMSQGCKGSECHLCPLLSKNGKIECVVCGGTGNGFDGAYATDDDDAKETPAIDLPPSKLPNTGFVETYNEEEFEKHRELVSKEIGKRMMEGWLLIDASCSKCVMPLMMDDLGNTNICVTCGPMDQQFDASTIATKDILALKASESEHDTIRENIVATLERDVADKSMAAEVAICRAKANFIEDYDDEEEDDEEEDPDDGRLGNNIIAALEKEVAEKAMAANAAINLARAALEGIETTDNLEELEMTYDATNDINSATKVVEVIHLEDADYDDEKVSKDEDPTVETLGLTQTETPIRLQTLAVNVDDNFSYIRGQTNMRNDNAPAVRNNDPPAFTSITLPPSSPPAIDAPESFTYDEPLTSFGINETGNNKETIETAVTTVREEMEVEKIIAVQEAIHAYRFVNKEPDPSEEKETITLPQNVDFADAGAIRQLVDDDEDNDSVACDLSTEMIVNMFLRSEHGYDLHDSAEALSFKDVKERIDIYVVTDMGSSISDDFKRKVAVRTLEKLHSSELKSTEMIVNMFLKSPHGYDLHQSENKMSLNDVKERVDIFIVTNMDSNVTNEFKFKVAQRIIDKVKYDNVIHLEHMSSPSPKLSPAPSASELPTLTIEECKEKLMDPSITLDEQIEFASMLERLAASPAATSSYIPQIYQQQPAWQSNFNFGDDDVAKSDTKRRKAPPRPEEMSKRPPMATKPRSFLPPKSPTHSNKFRKGNTVIVGGPTTGGGGPPSPKMRDDDYSVGGASRCSTVASEALESIYEKIEACKDKLLDPTNNLDEQLATAALLEKLATAAVAVKEMELLDA